MCFINVLVSKGIYRKNGGKVAKKGEMTQKEDHLIADPDLRQKSKIVGHLNLAFFCLH